MIIRLVLLMLKTRKRQTAMFVLVFAFLYLILRMTCGIPSDVQAVITLMTTLLGGFF